MTGWKTYRSGDLCKISSSKRIFAKEYKDSGIPFYRGKEIIEKQKGNKISTELFISQERYDEINSKHGGPLAGDMLLTSVGTLGVPYIVKEDEVFYFKDGNLTWFYDFDGLDSSFLYYWFLSPIGKMNIDSKAIGSTQKALTIETLSKFEISLPSLEEQRRIAGILGAIDDKIENNRRINDNLEQQAQALFDEWFVNDNAQTAEYNKVALTDIANYLNGIAMQKFRPKDDEKGIPVLKIKELGQGSCDSTSDLCSPSIDDKYIIDDGDIIFSWSGTLLVDIWCGGTCGLNQHLFKVTSDKYPKWFVYYWTRHHLAKFIRIAKDKAVTMGHIKRGDLEASEVLIPNAEILSKMDNIIAPIFDAIISKRVENKTLATIRDTLLPKLMNGEIKLPLKWQ